MKPLRMDICKMSDQHGLKRIMPEHLRQLSIDLVADYTVVSRVSMTPTLVLETRGKLCDIFAGQAGSPGHCI